MRSALMAIALLTTAPVFANEAADDQVNRTPVARELTRAEVKTEILSARQERTLAQNDYDLNIKRAPQVGSHNRAAVRAEAVKASRMHVVQELY